MATPAVAKPADWRMAATGLFLVALLTWPIVLVATMANSPSRAELAAPGELMVSTGAPTAFPVLRDTGDIGSFAFGYVEFDIDPRRPGGVPGFDSWPPGSGRR